MQLLTALLALTHTFISPSEADETTTTGYSKGLVILEQDTLKGIIQIKMDQDHLVLKNGSRYRVVTAREITKAVTPEGTYVGLDAGENPRLFEMLCAQNGMMIVYRENFKYFPTDIETTPPFFIFEKGKLEPIFKNKDILKVFGDDDKWMAYHIKTKNLDLNSKEDMIKAFEYYESEKIF
ncbi:hypothetical protein [Marinoscillum sp. MHG1-6]|uniref:hypothetical protein n=1 Tax=Marinoscillum sp. MHG1-6 TaxID=2959627 RepID=UPI002157BE44|nr:hypothetical protein [Marinoscillum sp. MHG1-6]